MRINNVAMLAIAIVCAALAALLSRAWLVSQSAKTPTAVATTSRAIVVAARDLRPGDALDAKAIKLVPWAGENLPKGAFLGTDALLKPGTPRIVQTAMAESEPVLEQKLQGAAANNALAARLGQNMQAFAIRVNDVAGVAGFVGPGDYVDVLLTFNSRPTDSGNGTNKAGVVVLLQNIRVLAVDQVTERKSQASAPKSVTLEVNTEDTQKLALASQIGQMSLALKRYDGTGDTVNTRPIAAEDFLPTRKDGQMQAPAAPGVGPEPETGTTVIVTRSVERKTYRVPESDPDANAGHQTLSHQR